MNPGSTDWLAPPITIIADDEENAFTMLLRQKGHDETLDRQALLRQTLILRKRQLRESDTQFANRLGVSLDLWRKTKTKRKVISLAVLRGVAKAFPDLHSAIIDELAG